MSWWTHEPPSHYLSILCFNLNTILTPHVCVNCLFDLLDTRVVFYLFQQYFFFLSPPTSLSKRSSSHALRIGCFRSAARSVVMWPAERGRYRWRRLPEHHEDETGRHQGGVRGGEEEEEEEERGGVLLSFLCWQGVCEQREREREKEREQAKNTELPIPVAAAEQREGGGEGERQPAVSTETFTSSGVVFLHRADLAELRLEQSREPVEHGSWKVYPARDQLSQR